MDDYNNIFIVLLFKNLIQIGRTERINNCSDPQFAKPLEMVYKFEEMQTLLFEVYDLDNDTTTLDDDDFLGRANANLGQVSLVFTVPLLTL